MRHAAVATDPQASRRVGPQANPWITGDDFNHVARWREDEAIVRDDRTTAERKRSSKRRLPRAGGPCERNRAESRNVHRARVQCQPAAQMQNKRQHLIEQQVPQRDARQRTRGGADKAIAIARHFEVGEVGESQKETAVVPKVRERQPRHTALPARGIFLRSPATVHAFHDQTPGVQNAQQPRHVAGNHRGIGVVLRGKSRNDLTFVTSIRQELPDARADFVQPKYVPEDKSSSTASPSRSRNTTLGLCFMGTSPIAARFSRLATR